MSIRTMSIRTMSIRTMSIRTMRGPPVPVILMYVHTKIIIVIIL